MPTTVQYGNIGTNASLPLTGAETLSVLQGGVLLDVSVTNLVAASNTLNIQTVVSAATVTPTFENDEVCITAQAVPLTLANPTGTAQNGWGVVIRIKDNGTARAIAYGAQYRAIGVTLPTTTVISKTLYLGMIFNSADTRWDVLSVCQEA